MGSSLSSFKSVAARLFSVLRILKVLQVSVRVTDGSANPFMLDLNYKERRIEVTAERQAEVVR